MNKSINNYLYTIIDELSLKNIFSYNGNIKKIFNYEEENNTDGRKEYSDYEVENIKKFGDKTLIELFRTIRGGDGTREYYNLFIDSKGNITKEDYEGNYYNINGEEILIKKNNSENPENGEIKYNDNIIINKKNILLDNNYKIIEESFQEEENGFYCTTLGNNGDLILLNYETGGELKEYPINLKDEKYKDVLKNLEDSIVGNTYFKSIRKNKYNNLEGILIFNNGDIKKEFELFVDNNEFKIFKYIINNYEKNKYFIIKEYDYNIIFLDSFYGFTNVNNYIGSNIIVDYKTNGINQALFKNEKGEIIFYDHFGFRQIFDEEGIHDLTLNNFYFHDGRLYSFFIKNGQLILNEGYYKGEIKIIRKIDNVYDTLNNYKNITIFYDNGKKGTIFFREGNFILEEDLKNEKIDYKKIDAPLSAINFVKFIKQGGEFLKPGELLEGFDDLENNFTLSELIGARRIEKFDKIFNGKISEKIKEKIENILDKLQNKEFNKNIITKINKNFDNLREKRDCSLYEGEIISSISGQDSSSQIWIRELLQNCIDVNDKGGEINIDFFSDKNKNFVTHVTDSKGMSLEDVFTKLLPLGTSGKKPGEGQGMFGQGFYSSAINAEKINIKTSIGNGITTYVTMIPNIINGQVYNFDISYGIKEEKFKGTTIERIDKSNGVKANFDAMIGTHNIVKYSGLVKNMDILNNGTKINSDIEEIFTLGNEVKKYSWGEENGFSMLKQGGIERLTKGGLYISDLKEEFLDYLPDFIIKEIKNEKISINIPNRIDLVSSRAGFKKKYLEEIKLNIFNLGTKFILKQFIDGNIILPMNPEDFLALDHYNKTIKKFPNSDKIISLAKNVNNGKELQNISDIELLNKSEENMILFLLYLEINMGEEKTSLAKIKENRDNQEYIESLGLKGKANNWVNENTEKVESLNNSMETGNKKVLSLKEISEEINLEKKEIEDFLNILDETFGELTQKLFNKNIKNNIYKRLDNDESRVADYGFNKNGIYMNWNVLFIKKWIEGINNIESLNDFTLTITHELTHLLEDGVAKFGSHEQTGKNSFAEVHKEVLRSFARIR